MRSLRLGFECWADYQLRPLAQARMLRDVHDVSKKGGGEEPSCSGALGGLLEAAPTSLGQCLKWVVKSAGEVPAVQQMKQLAGGALQQWDEAKRLRSSSEWPRPITGPCAAAVWTASSWPSSFRPRRRARAQCLSLPAGQQRLKRLMDVLGRACNITFRALPESSWWKSGRGLEHGLASMRLGWLKFRAKP